MKSVRLVMDGKNVNVRHANQEDFFVRFRTCVFQNAFVVILKLIVLMEKTNGTAQVSIVIMVLRNGHCVIGITWQVRNRTILVEDKRKVLTAAIVGSLGCGVLFVIALGCTRRLFHVQNSSSCSRTRRNFQNLANILQVREAPPTYEAAMGIEVKFLAKDCTLNLFLKCFGTRQSRSRPWRLTRHGLRRDSRRRRRRVGDNAPGKTWTTFILDGWKYKISKIGNKYEIPISIT